MAKHGVASVLTLALVLGVAAIPTVVQSIGVCYGVIGNNLPSPSDVVQLYKSNGIDSMRIYFPRSDILQALSGSSIALTMDVGNDQLGNIKVSTSVSQGVTAGFPPSAGTFSASHMGPIAQYLASTGAPLLANVYPYFAYVGNQAQIDINYALFTSPGTVVQDGGNAYQNLFDAIVDTFYSALESAGAGSVPIVVSESGWPSAGGTAASAGNAQTYNQNLINHVGQGTPKRPGSIETYIFAMFNENQKGGDETERHFGLFNPDQSPAYSINF
ncbi:putative beta-1,3-glucanase precursor [Oryza sativa Japonica Group]|uniref:Beta-1,3-glucanase n=2 Tax=Oryza sativa subsp. japonica TaxID=39947 RepID=Q0JG58_ORYSJ|nr:hypothetical protein EE612_007900 [Oryza sativa]BAD87988.1 putative beta-1,3-glucanase precursor [Oryza sativa Japonica Group]BAF07270.1 Os01g0940700 [Oryza sativa Japonica Group]BAS76152.1 Os01g0940700 [Oryza sativa Japonica Group]|eukprot:NP_001045356.1 Os01g0940700 [Oryza sativa Japonica Group]